jgi:hypothetical protein
MTLYTAGAALLLFSLGAVVKAATDVCYNPVSVFDPLTPSARRTGWRQRLLREVALRNMDRTGRKI